MPQGREKRKSKLQISGLRRPHVLFHCLLLLLLPTRAMEYDILSLLLLTTPSLVISSTGPELSEKKREKERGAGRETRTKGACNRVLRKREREVVCARELRQTAWRLGFSFLWTIACVSVAACSFYLRPVSMCESWCKGERHAWPLLGRLLREKEKGVDKKRTRQTKKIWGDGRRNKG